MWKETSCFLAVGTSGADYTIVEKRHFSEVDGPAVSPMEPTVIEYVLEDGRPLSAEKDGTFIVIETGEVLKATT